MPQNGLLNIYHYDDVELDVLEAKALETCKLSVTCFMTI